MLSSSLPEVTHVVEHHSRVAVAELAHLPATRLHIVLGDTPRGGRGGEGRGRTQAHIPVTTLSNVTHFIMYLARLRVVALATMRSGCLSYESFFHLPYKWYLRTVTAQHVSVILCHTQ